MRHHTQSQLYDRFHAIYHTAKAPAAAAPHAMADSVGRSSSFLDGDEKTYTSGDTPPGRGQIGFSVWHRENMSSQ